ncbi:hypothetical protein [Sphingomonas metalli]|uniref:hypothetical protein n=1 Tax=Sphingomonas metalli TaxID=1779358 RepID=UPI00166BDBB2|nr:hypothetical protein [Sphingomonas metalli]
MMLSATAPAIDPDGIAAAMPAPAAGDRLVKLDDDQPGPQQLPFAFLAGLPSWNGEVCVSWTAPQVLIANVTRDMSEAGISGPNEQGQAQ